MQAEKDKMAALLKRCQVIINGEVSLLEEWQSSGAMSAAGKADCRRSIVYITVGATSSKAVMDGIVAQAGAISPNQVTNAPSKSAEDSVANLESNLNTRRGWDGPDLEQPWLETALSQAEDNSAHAADSAAGILAECTK